MTNTGPVTTNPATIPETFQKFDTRTRTGTERTFSHDRDLMKYQLGNHDTVEELGSLVPRSTARSQGLNRAVMQSSTTNTTFENGCKRTSGVETCVTTQRHSLTDQPVKIRNSDSAGKREHKTALGDFGVLRFRNMKFAITKVRAMKTQQTCEC